MRTPTRKITEILAAANVAYIDACFSQFGRVSLVVAYLKM